MYRCSWNKVANFLESRMYIDGEIEDFCFKHIPDQAEAVDKKEAQMPWWIAFVIGQLLVVITCLIIIAVFKWRQKRKAEEEPV